ncbi:CAIB/BAIF family enzyme [Gaeumannomyces tritici R3-111a-1]|uniref:CAIB/BAIF family enzyme n=1 Tax=Gaeumannomyces tritici (strain R3-111a-1) TaxID=644352 RepID=J3P1Z9_GAET3|nr:CAIB/BAIF family enzyme [Gaeumannomyces tritici R3-111a-1]EJT73691.1 CAIB/BAIF family enzyme [Gaeumannomyces tritici R3-111a-1]
MTTDTPQSYSIRKEADRIFRDVLLRDARLQLPAKVLELAGRTSFNAPDTVDTPFLPVPLRFAEVSAALWALAGTLGSAVARDRFGAEAAGGAQDVTVNTDLAALFLASAVLARVNGKPLSDPAVAAVWGRYDLGRMADPWRRFCTNVYPTRDGRWFHLHGSMNADRSLAMLGLPRDDAAVSTQEEAVAVYADAVRRHDAEWLDVEANEHWRQAGTVCLTRDEFDATEQGRATAADGLYILSRHDDASQNPLPPVPYPAVRDPNDRKPLRGIKMVDISRVIAAPTVARLAAFFGATVVRVSHAGQPEVGALLMDGNLGKRDASLDLKSGDGRAALRRLVEDADVVLDGYRPGALDRLGFGQAYLHALARRRGKGMVVVRENCYGWSGPWAGRSGWQQISDCVTGVSWMMGEFLGLDEPVVPPLPSSDYQTGLVGLIGILTAIDKRATEGGSYTVDISLNQFNRFLLAQGALAPEVQRGLRELHPTFRPRHHDDMMALLTKVMGSLQAAVPRLFRPAYFDSIPSDLGGGGGGGPAGTKDVLTYLRLPVELGVTPLGPAVGSCLPGTHKAEWPQDEGGEASGAL